MTESLDPSCPLHDVVSIEIRTIIEEELLPHVYVLVGIYADPVVAADHQDFHLAVGLARVVGEPDLAPHPGHVGTAKARVKNGSGRD